MAAIIALPGPGMEMPSSPFDEDLDQQLVQLLRSGNRNLRMRRDGFAKVSEAMDILQEKFSYQLRIGDIESVVLGSKKGDKPRLQLHCDMREGDAISFIRATWGHRCDVDKRRLAQSPRSCFERRQPEGTERRERHGGHRRRERSPGRNFRQYDTEPPPPPPPQPRPRQQATDQVFSPFQASASPQDSCLCCVRLREENQELRRRIEKLEAELRTARIQHAQEAPRHTSAQAETVAEHEPYRAAGIAEEEETAPAEEEAGAGRADSETAEPQSETCRVDPKKAEWQRAQCISAFDPASEEWVPGCLAIQPEDQIEVVETTEVEWLYAQRSGAHGWVPRGSIRVCT
mmetsp:Transcript_27883/g.64784  ORF Transcript_27883/g.64784 Transcript_27883/m.64784 type:complete len:345 (-) Transcript_27883:164-1198(-)|eukprot:CAMPEP_0178410652 /NCGR_PEP_ID=MMETSP0689_2-20121128/21093_1 /TAXON_ID=160604 /ORGANISM="Amphidinium massartii, Strain CS-259" /LENGTH=344 /DNA_ID=CAMNT_0020031841 /DNA_START=56 /DNA_END=1090 /DNA_ORIENTATION=-